MRNGTKHFRTQWFQVHFCFLYIDHFFFLFFSSVVFVQHTTMDLKKLSNMMVSYGWNLLFDSESSDEEELLEQERAKRVKVENYVEVVVKSMQDRVFKMRFRMKRSTFNELLLCLQPFQGYSSSVIVYNYGIQCTLGYISGKFQSTTAH